MPEQLYILAAGQWRESARLVEIGLSTANVEVGRDWLHSGPSSDGVRPSGIDDTAELRSQGNDLRGQTRGGPERCPGVQSVRHNPVGEASGSVRDRYRLRSR